MHIGGKLWIFFYYLAGTILSFITTVSFIVFIATSSEKAGIVGLISLVLVLLIMAYFSIPNKEKAIPKVRESG
ncbi:MAG: hypothetical protein ABH830_03860 [Patescibacteria group bacterium]